MRRSWMLIVFLLGVGSHLRRDNHLKNFGRDISHKQLEGPAAPLPRGVSLTSEANR